MGEVDFGCNQLRCFNLVPMPWGGGWVGCTSTGACYGCAPLCIARCERRGFGGGALLDVSGGIGQGGSGSMFRVSVVVGPSRPVSGEWWVALERVTDVRRCARCDLGGEHRSMSGGIGGGGGIGTLEQQTQRAEPHDPQRPLVYLATHGRGQDGYTAIAQRQRTAFDAVGCLRWRGDTRGTFRRVIFRLHFWRHVQGGEHLSHRRDWGHRSM